MYNRVRNLLVYILIDLFDNSTRKEWKKTIDKSNDTPPTIEQVKEFIKGQVENLDDGKCIPTVASNENSNTQPKGKGKGRQQKGETETQAAHSLQTSCSDPPTKSTVCVLCSGEHSLAKCEQFAKQSVTERRDFAQNKRLCFNCLGTSHGKSRCKSRYSCFICKAKHHTRLHIDNTSSSNTNPVSIIAPNSIVAAVTSTNNVNVISHDTVPSAALTTHVDESAGILLATALVRVVGPKNKQIIVKTLVDPCSQVSLITRSLCNQLGLMRRETQIREQVVGDGDPQLASKLAQFELTPHFNSNYILKTTALVLPKLSSYSPPIVKATESFSYLKNLQLADPRFLEYQPIQLLLGADVYSDIIEEAIVRGTANQPIALNSKLGWLITGKCSDTVAGSQAKPHSISVLHCSSEEDTESRLIELLQEFWKVEEIESGKNSCSREDKACEELFQNTTYRDEKGKYVVSLPWKDGAYASKAPLGKSFMYAISALKRQELNFRKDKRLEAEYKKFMQEYQDLGHMTEIQDTEPSAELNNLFLPHHGVWKENSSTTKLRTVFNGSSKFNATETLNDLLYSGPNLLKNPIVLICSIRHYRFALSADLEKMFRHIGINPKERRFQTILWRWRVSERVRMFLLNTVTYGLTCSLYLAIRVLLQLARDYAQEHPLAAAVIEDEMYSDNVLSGAHTLPEAKEKMNELITLFRKGQMNLRKWTSNDPRILESLPNEMLAENKITMFATNSSLPMLGIAWHAAGDYYRFYVENVDVAGPMTKRRVLSRIARIFDPLGWIAPITISAKIMLQTLWRLKLSWDDPLPSDVVSDWTRWVEDLPAVNAIKIPRWTGYTLQSNVELHGFADASKFAYGAVVYIRLLSGDNVSVSLQLAKSTVAPVKTLSIPRLELCATLLLTRLVTQYLSAIKFDIKAVHLWTDSADVLFWLRDQLSRWNIFVANRCSEIQTSLPQAFWHHVRSYENPADIISRGIPSSELPSHSRWWHGPTFLSSEAKPWPKKQDDLNFGITHLVTTDAYASNPRPQSPNTIEFQWPPLQKFSALVKIKRITAYWLRFIAKISCKLATNKNSYKFLQLPFVRASTHASDLLIYADELENAELCCFYITQRQFLNVEYKLLAAGKRLNAKHPLAPLNPVIQHQLIKVGGRLSNSLLAESNKLPIILPRDSTLTTLLIRDAHSLTLHGGTRATLSTLRQRIWIMRGRAAVKRVVRNCYQCARYAARIPQQIMGDLPEARGQPAKPFEKSGVDYAGPFKVRLTKSRGKGTMKAYVCVFVCMVTKAVHLELAEDCTSDAFIAAFHRFTARMGHCRELYSDNGTNFVGADSQLREMLMQAVGQYSTVVPRLSELGTQWYFNPPSAPHFGGLLESAVKSLKFHLRRLIGEQILTFSEFSTLLCKIEACLNSRPLVEISDDPTDLGVLTPAHLLIQRASFLIPEPDSTLTNVPIGKRWQLLTQTAQHFWNRWRAEYLSALQKRNKWARPYPSPKVGDLVLIRSEFTPPGQWPLTRISDVHPGTDGRVRVATVTTGNNTYRRPIVKLVLLPKNES